MPSSPPRKLWIERYVVATKQQRAPTLLQKIGAVTYTAGAMVTGQIKPNDQKPGILGRATLPYPFLFFILFIASHIAGIFLFGVQVKP